MTTDRSKPEDPELDLEKSMNMTECKVLDEIVYTEPHAGIHVRGLIEFMLITVGAQGAF